MNLRITILFWSAVLFVTTAPLALAQGTYTQIDYPGGINTVVTGISSAGDIAGSATDLTSHQGTGFVLSHGVYTTVQHKNAPTLASAINAAGGIVGNGALGFEYNLQTQVFTKIAYPGTVRVTIPAVINDSGTVAGSYKYHGNLFGFRLVDSIYSQILPPGTKTVYVRGVSASGTLVGNATSKRTGRTVNFSYSEGIYQRLLIPNTPTAVVSGISPSGNALVGGYVPSSGVVAGFVYRDNTLQTLQFPGSHDTIPYGIDDAGEVAGYFLDSANVTHGFLWTPPATAAKE